MNIPLLQTYSVNNLTVLRLQYAPEFATMRAPARPHTLAPPGLLPLTESGGRRPRGARVVWVVEYMCIYEPGHIRCRCRFRTRCRFRPDPSLRFAALRGRVFEPRSGPRPSPAPGGPSPARCPREGRCGAGAPVAHGSSGVFGPRRRGFPRVAVSRLAPLRCARSTRPPLGPLGDLGRRWRPFRGASSQAAPHRSRGLLTPSCRGEGRTCPSEAV